MDSHGAYRRLRVWAVRCVVVASMLVGMELAPGRWLSTFAIASPSDIAERIWWWLTTDDEQVIYSAMAETATHASLGFAFGASAGMFLAALFFLLPSVRLASDPYVTLLHTVPRVALLPLFILVMGADSRTIIAFVTASALFPIYYNVNQGFQSGNAAFIGALQVLGLSRFGVLRSYVVPIAWHYIVSALFIAVPQALLSAIVAEMLLSSGIGGLITLERGQFDVVGVYAATIVATTLGVVANWAVRVASARTTSRIAETPFGVY